MDDLQKLVADMQDSFLENEFSRKKIILYINPGIGDYVISVDNLIRKVCKQNNIAVQAVKGKCRETEIVEVRYILMFLISESFQLTRAKTGAIFKKDHSSVSHGIKNLRSWLKTDKDFKKKFERAAALIERIK